MMTEKEQQPRHHMTARNHYGWLDEEAQSKELRNKKLMKYLKYAAAFVVFETIVVLSFGLTVVKIESPKFDLKSGTFEKFDVDASSFNMRINAQLWVDNTNFGYYKYNDSTIEFFYKDAQVGNALVPKARARARTVKKFNVTVDVLANDSGMGNDSNSSGILQLSSQSRLTGKVELIKVMDKYKFANMNCTMLVNITAKALQNVTCY